MAQKKKWLSQKEFRKVQAKLDSVGIITTISRTLKGFSFVYNLREGRDYASRETCRKAIVRMYNHRFPEDKIKTRKYGKKERVLPPRFEG